MGAVVGATEALAQIASARGTDDQPIEERSDEIATALAAAAPDLDSAGYAECGIPLFSAIYVSTSWADCHGPVDIPAHAVIGRVDGSTGSCHASDSPGFLPCWDVEAGYLPTDCRTGEVVRADEGSWVAV